MPEEVKRPVILEVSYSVELKRFEDGKEVDSIRVDDYGEVDELMSDLEDAIMSKGWDEEILTDGEEDEDEEETKDAP